MSGMMNVLQEAETLARRQELERSDLLNRLEAEERRLLLEVSKIAASIAAIRGVTSDLAVASTAVKVASKFNAPTRGAVQMLVYAALAVHPDGLNTKDVYDIVAKQRPNTCRGSTEIALKRLCAAGSVERWKTDSGPDVDGKWTYGLTGSAPMRMNVKKRAATGMIHNICLNVLKPFPDGLRAGAILAAVKTHRPSATTSVVGEALRALHKRDAIERVGVRFRDDTAGGGYIYKTKDVGGDRKWQRVSTSIAKSYLLRKNF